MLKITAGTRGSSDNFGISVSAAGDVNKDGIINYVDFSTLENSIGLGFNTGYINTDINGDGILESSDYSFIENKVQTIRTVLHP